MASSLNFGFSVFMPKEGITIVPTVVPSGHPASLERAGSLWERSLGLHLWPSLYTARATNASPLDPYWPDPLRLDSLGLVMSHT